MRMYGCSTVRRYRHSMDTGVQIYRTDTGVLHSTTGVLTYMYGHTYGRSTFPFLSDIPYLAINRHIVH